MIETKDPSLAPQAASVVLRDDERQRCEVWTRVMGYHRPMASFNTGKKGEAAEPQGDDFDDGEIVERQGAHMAVRRGAREADAEHGRPVRRDAALRRGVAAHHDD